MNKLWYYRRGSEAYGPFSPQELKALAVSGQLLASDDVRKDPSTEWTQAANVKGLIPSVIATESVSTQWDSYLAKNSEPANVETPSDTPSLINTPTTPDTDSQDAINESQTDQGKDPSAMDEWYYTQNGQRLGPIKSDRLKALATSGGLGSDDLVWKQGMDGWVKASQIKGLLPLTPPASNAPPPLPVVSASVPPTVAMPLSEGSLPNKGINPLAIAAASWFCGPLGYILLGQAKKGMFVLLATIVGSCLCLFPGVIVAILGVVDSYNVAKAVSEGQQVGANEFKIELLYKIVRIIDKTATYRA